MFGDDKPDVVVRNDMACRLRHDKNNRQNNDNQRAVFTVAFAVAVFQGPHRKNKHDGHHDASNLGHE